MATVRSWTTERLDRFRGRLREALRTGDRELFDECMEAVEDAPIPPIGQREQAARRRARREEDERREDRPGYGDRKRCRTCGALYLVECGHCRRHQRVEERARER